MIENRPEYLKDIDYSNSIPPNVNIDIDFTSLPPIFTLDLHQLNGLQPITKSLADYIKTEDSVPTIMVNPSKKEIEYYRKNNLVEWQLISVVFSLFNFKKSNNVLTGMPYSVSLFPGSKRGEIEPWNIDLIEIMDIEKTLGGGWVYTEFNPFRGWHNGICGQYNIIAGNTGIKTHSDSVGFVWGQYLIADKFDIREVLILEDSSAPKTINNKFKRYRSKLYFEKFKDIKPRKIWGCESPIELFVLQGLVKSGLKPDIQTLIFRDGSIFPNYHKMIEEHEWKTQDKLITNVDFYFPNEKVAIFCDGFEFHNTKKAKEKDSKIDTQLKKIGITSLRFNGKEITEELEKVIDEIAGTVEKTK